MYASALPLGISFYLLFIPPEGLGHTSLFLWFLVWSVVVKIFITMFAVPHLAFGAELSTDYHERSSVMTYNSRFIGLGGLVAMILAYGVYFKKTPEFENGLLNGAQYPKFAFTIAFLIVIIILYTSLSTRREVPRLPKAPDHLPSFDLKQFFHDMWVALRNPNYMVMMLGVLFVYVTIGTNDTISLYISTYFWEFSPFQLMLASVSVVISIILAFLVIPRCHKRFGKKKTLLMVFACFVVSITPTTLRLCGWYIPNHHPLLFPIFLVCVVITYTGLLGLQISAFSMIADIADENELETGRRQEGIFFSTRTLASKFTTGFGHLLGGVAIDHFILFPKGGKGVAQIGSVAPDILWRMGLFAVIISIVFYSMAFFFYARYDISEEKYEKTRQKLAEMRDKSGDA